MSTGSIPEPALGWRERLLVAGVALLVVLAVAALQPVPGYMDAAYYYAGGIQLADGNGFEEQMLWNYLDQPVGLPHPSHAYWYPLASLIAAGGMLLTGVQNFWSARIGFLLLATLAPVVAMELAYRFTHSRRLALSTAVLCLFPGYYLPFIATSDNYGLYLLLGAAWFLLLERVDLRRAALLGLLAGLFNLARSDGLLWLPLTLLAVWISTWRQGTLKLWSRRLAHLGLRSLAAAGGFLLVMAGWWLRNLSVFGSLLPPGSRSVLWMTSYNQLYTFTPQVYTFDSLLATGWGAILLTRLEALLQNLGTAFFAEGMIFLAPLAALGAWSRRKDLRVQLGILGWLLLITAQSLLFPFASVSGGFFHAGTAFQALWFVLAPLGLDLLVRRIPSGGKTARLVAHLVLGTFMLLFSILLVKMRVVDQGWNEGEYRYQSAEVFLQAHDAAAGEIVMVRNPPAYFVMTGRPAIVVPFGDRETLLAAAERYGAVYLLLEAEGLPPDLDPLYDGTEIPPGVSFLGEIDHVRIYRLEEAR